jgi:hypothetical protein
MPNVNDYMAAVKDIAQEAIDEYPDDDDGRQRYAVESVDGSEFIIHYPNNEIVMNATQNEPDDDDIYHAIGVAPATWREIRNQSARIAMHTDVQDEIARLQS